MTRRAVIVIGLATCVFLVAAAVTTYSHDTFDDEAADSDAQSTPPPRPATELGKLPPTVSARTTPPSGRCPQNWNYFVNPVLHYDVCYPTGWGFYMGESTGLPANDLLSGEMYGLQLFSPEAFPWPPGELPYSVVRQADAVYVELNVLQPHISRSRLCKPERAFAIKNATARLCVDRRQWDGWQLPLRENGDVYDISVDVPLLRKPIETGIDLSDARLFLRALATATAYEKHYETFLEILRTLQPMR